MTKRELVERLRFLGCPAVMQGSVSRVVRTYPKGMLERWLNEYERTSESRR